MTKQRTLRGPVAAALSLAFSCALVACGDAGGDVHAGEDSTSVAAGSAETAPVPARVLERSAERWAKIVEANEDETRWVEVYRFLAPARKEEQPLSSYLAAKAKFAYDQPSRPQLLKVDGDKAYVATRATWLAYRNPQVAQAAGGADLVRPMQMIEEWHWVDGDWYLYLPHRESDFHREHPDFFAQRETPAGEGENDAPEKR